MDAMDGVDTMDGMDAKENQSGFAFLVAAQMLCGELLILPSFASLAPFTVKTQEYLEFPK
jgi:hypothetical protein